MTLRPIGLLVIPLALAGFAWAQSQAPGSISSRRPAPAGGKGSAAAKAVKPDPDLLDGSIYEAEKRPLYGMLSEIELPGSEQKSDQVGGQPQPAGQQNQSASMPRLPMGGGPQQQQQQAQQQPPPADAAGQQIQSGTDDRDSSQQGQQAQAQGIQAQNLEGPQSAGGPEQSKPRDMQIGDATLQIQTTQQSPQVVGTETPTSTQQYEKKVPAGQQTDNRNRGVEKGKVMPKGI